MYYSKSTGGFYQDDRHAGFIPADAVAIPEGRRDELLAGEATGLRIVPDEHGFPTLVDAPPLSAEAMRAALTSDVQNHLDATAQSFGYDDIRSAVTYAEEPAVPKFQAEGRALRAWRSRVWARAYEVLAEVEMGSRPLPAAADLLGLMPVFEGPAA